MLPASVYWCLLISRLTCAAGAQATLRHWWLHGTGGFHCGWNRACGAAGGASAAAVDDIRSGAHSNCSHQHDGDDGARLQAAAARGGDLRPCGTPYFVFWGGNLV